MIHFLHRVSAGGFCLRVVAAFARTVCVAWVCSVHADGGVALVDALAALREQGYEIVYSNDLVTASQRIDVPTISFDRVRAALAPLGLAFLPSGKIWLIARDQAATLSLHLVSGGGEPIDLAEFQIDGQRARTVVRGNAGIFIVKVAAMPVNTITVRVHDYQSRTLTSAQLDAPIALQPVSRIENVIVTGSRHVVPVGIGADSATTISAGEIDAMPALAGDSMRATNSLPGMSSVGVSAKPLVRGGVQDETLTLLDGIELLDPYHLADFQSIFSSIDARIVNQINVYTGGFPARYGNRMSGVVDVSTLSPDVAPRTELGISVLSVFANARGTSDDQRTDWLMSARRGNLELLAEWLDPHWGSPKFDDAYVRIGRRVSDDVKVYAGMMVARDDVSITDNEEVARSDIDTSYGWTRLDVNHSDALRSSTLLSYVTSDRDKTEQNREASVSLGSLEYRQRMQKYSLHSDFTYSQDVDLMEFGLNAEYATSHYDSVALIDRGLIAEILGRPRIDTFDIHTDPSGWSGGGYWSGEVWLFDRIALQPGIRWDFQRYYGQGSPSQVSPRLGVRWNFTDATTLRFTVGRYFQPEGIQEMKVTDGVDHFLSPQQSDHYIASLEWNSPSGVRLGIEAYYKDYEATRVRFENLFNPFVLLPELGSDRVAITSSRAQVTGIDAQARFDVTPQLAGVLRYSYMDADDRIGGSWEPRSWSQHHTAQSTLLWQTDSMSASAALTWHSGWRTTRLPESVPIGTQIPVLSIYNNSALSDYASLDVSLSRTWHYGRASITAQADVTNALNRSNHGGAEYNSQLTATDVLLTRNNESLLPWVPTIGIIIAF